MKKIKFNNLLPFFCLLVMILSSCSSAKKITYFEDLPDSGAIKSIQTTTFREPTVQADDILTITIETIDPLITAQLNQAPAQVTVAGGNPLPITGYLVSKNGSIELPLLGQINVVGLTTLQIQDTIRNKALIYLKKPTVQVRFGNYKINVIGEVNRPSTYTLPNEQVSVIDAIGLAGDLTIYGKRDNVLVIRDNNGKKEFGRLNLNNSKIFASPYFYLKQNDVIYVQPNKAKMAANNIPRNQNIALIATLLAVLATLISRF